MRSAAVVVGLVALSATQPAGAQHSWLAAGLSNPAAGANSDVTFTLSYGSNLPSGATSITWPSGFKLAHADNSTSPITPPPNNGDTVVSGTVSARWAPLCVTSTMNVSGTWAEPIDPGAPAGTVAQVRLTVGLNAYTMYIRLVSGAYVTDVPSFYAGACGSTTAATAVLSFLGTVAGSSPTRVVVQNPTATGSHMFSGAYTDTGGSLHSDTAFVTVI